MTDAKGPRKKRETAADEPHVDVTPGEASELRRRAEGLVEDIVDACVDADLETATGESLASVIHELRVHQIELEMQNEELRRAQLQLEDQRSKYLELFDQAPVGYVTLSDKGIVGDANLTTARLLGVSRSVLVGKPFSVFVSSADRDAYYAHLGRMCQSAAPLTFEIRLQRLGDDSDLEPTSFWALLESRPGELEDDDTTSFLVAFADISERKQADESLRESDSSLQAILSATADGILAVDSAGRVLFSNDQFAELWRIPSEVLSSKDDARLLELVVDQLADPQVFAQRVEELYSSSAESLDTLVFKDGRVFERLSRPLMTAEKVNGRVWSFRDITERKRDEAALASLALRYKSLMSSASDGMHVVDESGHVVEANDAFCSMLGYTQDELSRINVADWAVEWAGDELLEKIRSLIENPAVIETQMRRKDGTVREFEIHCSGIVLDGCDYLYASARDITDRKIAERERVGRIERAANVDRLTGLHNLRGFLMLAEQAIAQAGRAGLGVGLIFCDMDGLKTLNDTYGHAEGDRALKDVAALLESTLRMADAIARVGGDEFVVLAVGSERADVDYLNERLQSVFSLFNARKNRPYVLSVSSGVSWCEPGEACELRQLRAAADAAMYAEKARRAGGVPSAEG